MVPKFDDFERNGFKIRIFLKKWFQNSRIIKEMVPKFEGFKEVVLKFKDFERNGSKIRVFLKK